jgi:hypothetical protein
MPKKLYEICHRRIPRFWTSSIFTWCQRYKTFLRRHLLFRGNKLERVSPTTSSAKSDSKLNNLIATLSNFRQGWKSWSITNSILYKSH